MSSRIDEKEFERHSNEIAAWLEDVKADYPDVNDDEAAHDTIIAYISAEVGETTPMGLELRRRLLGF